MKQVFLIMPDPHLRQGIKDVLELEGDYEVIAFENGQEGLDNLKTLDRMPDIILCNFMMPGISGLEVLKKLRTDKDPNYASLPFIITTACSTEEVERAMHQLNLPKGTEYDYFLQKPFNSDELIDFLKVLL